MSEKMKPQCLLGHGDCSQNCSNHESAKKITEKLGKDFNPFLSRLNVVFGDALSPQVNILDVAAALGGCDKEVVPVIDDSD